MSREPVAAVRTVGVPLMTRVTTARVAVSAFRGVGPVLMILGSSHRRSVSDPRNADIAVPFSGGHGHLPVSQSSTSGT
jgi:hypothetical protein